MAGIKKRRKIMGSLFSIVILFFISFSAFAKTGVFDLIKVKASNFLWTNLSGIRILTGEICFNKPIIQMFQSDCGTLTEINAEHKVKFFYPDLDTDVTSSVTLSQATNGQSFSYEATVGETLANPTFYVVVELQNENLIDKVNLQKTLKRQIEANPGIDESVINQLAQVESELMLDYPVAVYEWPLLQNGKAAEPFRYTTHSSKYRVTFELDRGDSFVGETNKLTYIIHSLVEPFIPTDGYVIGVDNQVIFNDFIKHQNRSLTGVINLSQTAIVRSAYARVTGMGSLYSWKTI